MRALRTKLRLIEPQDDAAIVSGQGDHFRMAHLMPLAKRVGIQSERAARLDVRDERLQDQVAARGPRREPDRESPIDQPDQRAALPQKRAQMQLTRVLLFDQPPAARTSAPVAPPPPADDAGPSAPSSCHRGATASSSTLPPARPARCTSLLDGSARQSLPALHALESLPAPRPKATAHPTSTSSAGQGDDCKRVCPPGGIRRVIRRPFVSGKTSHARRLIAARSPANALGADRRRAASNPRAKRLPRGLRTSKTTRFSLGRAYRRRLQRVQQHAKLLRHRARDPKWIMRTCGIAGVAVLLALLVMSSHAPPPGIAATGGSGAGSLGGVNDGFNSGAADSSTTTSAPPTTAGSTSSGEWSKEVPRRSGNTAAMTTRVAPTSPSASPPAPAAPSTGTASTPTPAKRPLSTTTTAQASPTPITLSITPYPSNGCAITGITCQGGLIYHHDGGDLASGAAIPISAFRALALSDHVTLGQVEIEFGLPDSRATLRAFLGTGWSTALSADQPEQASCAYYLNSAARASRAFQLCFNAAQRLVEKTIISISGTS